MEGMLNSPNDCKMPTNEYARPVNIIMGNIIFDSPRDMTLVASEISGATRLIKVEENIRPKAVITTVINNTTLIY